MQTDQKKEMEKEMKKALSIAGSDCSGGAGIQADLKTFSAYGVFGMSVITSVVAENTCRVIAYQNVSLDIIKKQVDAVFEDIVPDATKIGMLSDCETMEVVAEKLKEWKPRNIVVDPVMYAKNGDALMDPLAIDTLISQIIPLADVITPNVPEAEKIANMKIVTIEDMYMAAKKIQAMGCQAVVVKGGHMEGDAIDVLFDGKGFYEYPKKRVDTVHTHGTGCTFSSAIASALANGLPIYKAVAEAKKYIHTAIVHAPKLGKGFGPTNHFYELYESYFEVQENG
jgi:hydroxymethylpyrimidine/phosphomethylpyrimidine kinase